MMIVSSSSPANPEDELNAALESGKGSAFSQFILAMLNGATSAAGKTIGAQYGSAETGELVGSMASGAISGIADASSGKNQENINHLINAWLKLQQDEVKEIGITLFEVVSRLDLQDAQVNQRLESPEYLRLMKKCFRDWSAAESEEKRVLIRNLLINAAGAHITSDSVVNLFVRWIDTYSEDHLNVVSVIYNQQGLTRQQIWARMRPDDALPREDSSEADLFKLLIYDLSTGHIIRQHRDKDPYGNFLPKPKRQRGSAAGFTSAFEDGEQYELTELGQQFVHYTMTERIQKIAATSDENTR